MPARRCPLRRRGQGGTWPGTRSSRPLWMNGLTPGTQDAGADPGAQRPRDDDRAAGLLVLPGDGGQQAAGLPYPGR
jgi:hypothetical protein